jgi:hypothetical protein
MKYIGIVSESSVFPKSDNSSMFLFSLQLSYFMC